LGGGDDYELLIAVPTTSLAGFTESARISGVAITDLGVLTENVPLQVVGLDGSALLIEHFGYDHFSR
jgi:thiamine-monophosphate kinase